MGSQQDVSAAPQDGGPTAPTSSRSREAGAALVVGRRKAEPQPGRRRGEPRGRASSLARRTVEGSWPAVLLAAAVLAVWGWPVLGSFGSARLSNPGDSVSFEYYLGWNVHALLHGENPFFTPNMYAPGGLDLGNAISVPAVSLLLAPVTVLFGTTAAYNVGCLLAAYLAALFTYLLGHELTGRRGPAVLGGLLMVVNPYFSGHFLSHFNLIWIFGTAAVAYFFLRHLHHKLRARWFVLATGLVVAFTFGASTELAVTETVLGGTALLVALVVSPRRRELLLTTRWLLGGGVLGGLLATPVVVASLQAGVPASPANPPSLYSSDLFNLVAPTSVILARPDRQASWTGDWLGNGAENTAYLSVALLVLALGLLLVRRDRTSLGLGLYCVVALVFSLGPALVIDGSPHLWLPWALTSHVPGLDHALPARFSTFVFLSLCLLVAHAWPRSRSGVTAASLGLLLSFCVLLPDLPGAGVPTRVADRDFISSGAYRGVINPDEIVLVLPGGQAGSGLQWVTDSRFYFRLPTGNGGGAEAPRSLDNPLALALYVNDPIYDYDRGLARWARNRRVSVVLVAEGDRFWSGVAQRSFGMPDQVVRGVQVWRLRG